MMRIRARVVRDLAEVSAQRYSCCWFLRTYAQLPGLFPLLPLPLGTTWHPVSFSFDAKPKAVPATRVFPRRTWRSGLVLSVLWDAVPRPCRVRGWGGLVRRAGGGAEGITCGEGPFTSGPLQAGPCAKGSCSALGPVGPPSLPSACQLGPNLISVLSVRTPLKLNSAHYQQLSCHVGTLPPKAALAR